MSERMTSVYLCGSERASCVARGFADWGRIDPVEMITRLREQARQEIAEAEAVLAAPDEAFVVETYLGPIAQRKREQIWPASEGTNESSSRRTRR